MGFDMFVFNRWIMTSAWSCKRNSN